MSEQGSEHAPQIEDLRREEMRTPDEVAAMVRLKALGWGAKRIAAELGCARNTVRRWLVCGRWGRPGAAMQVAQPPEPSRTARMTAMPASPAHRQPRINPAGAHQPGKA